MVRIKYGDVTFTHPERGFARTSFRGGDPYVQAGTYVVPIMLPMGDKHMPTPISFRGNVSMAKNPDGNFQIKPAFPGGRTQAIRLDGDERELLMRHVESALSGWNGAADLRKRCIDAWKRGDAPKAGVTAKPSGVAMTFSLDDVDGAGAGPQPVTAIGVPTEADDDGDGDTATA